VNSFATQDRSTIITTHMMIETDTLCDQIAIVSQGRLKVIGTQQHLKNKFGSSYLLQLNMLKSSPENQASAMSFVHKYPHP
jgi:ABC-type multidrug transport system ATPase subunit